MENFTTAQLCQFLTQWGSEFKKIGGADNAYYQTCVDSYQCLMGGKLYFYGNKGSVSRALNQLADEMTLEIKKKVLSKDFSIRADLFRHIATEILKHKQSQLRIFDNCTD